MARKEAKELAKPKPAKVPSPLVDADTWFQDILAIPLPLLGFPGLKFPTEDLRPSVDIFVEKSDVVVRAELPGVKKEDIEITLTGHTISIAGEKRKEKVEKKDYYRWESSYGSFVRTFTLPTEVQTVRRRLSSKTGFSR